MPRLNDITSTEKLLNVIRGKDNKVSEKKSDIHGGSPFKKIFKYSFPETFLHHKSAAVGVDISPEYLRLVKLTKSSDNIWKLIDWKCIHIPGTFPKWSAEFVDFLKSEITLFCGTFKGINIWILMSAANVEVRHILIPKVSKKDIPNAVYWTTKKEATFDENANFIDFEVQGEALEQGITKLSIMVYIAPVKEVEQIKGAFSKINLPLTGITIMSFAIQNIFRFCSDITFEERFAILFIGNDFSRIDIYNSGNLVMTRDIKAGTNSMVETLMEEYNSRHKSSEFTGPGYYIDREQSYKMLFSLDPESSPDIEKGSPVVLEKEQIFSLIMPAIERAVRQVDRTFGHYLSLPGGEKIEKIYVSGVLSVCKPLVDYVGEQLGIKSGIFDIVSQQSAVMGEELKSTPVRERIGFIPAIGTALSDNKGTLNFMFTYKDKEQESGIRSFNRNVFSAFIAAVFVCAVIFGYQSYAARQKRIVLTKLEQQFPGNNISVNRDMIIRIAANIKQQQQGSKDYSKRYRGMAIISEISALTPSDIGLTRLKIFHGIVDAAEQGAEAGDGLVESVSVGGLIPGERSYAEAALSRYVMKLDSSPMFSRINVKESNYGAFLQSGKGGAGLYFTINMKTG